MKMFFYIEQADSSALRAWMIEVLKKIKKLNNYFKYELKNELFDEDYEDFDQ
mgnify:CR=1 FL=1